LHEKHKVYNINRLGAMHYHYVSYFNTLPDQAAVPTGT